MLIPPTRRTRPTRPARDATVTSMHGSVSPAGRWAAVALGATVAGLALAAVATACRPAPPPSGSR
ncbi:hypothetical protein BJF90_11380 [Pseudonocardia sp. CNS-004]|nr:hypothetical protein BJF90_11380 [Pseudonocardia sp. CNS-004]